MYEIKLKKTVINNWEGDYNYYYKIIIWKQK